MVSEAAATYLVAEQVEQAEIRQDMNADKVATSYQPAEQTVVGVSVEITDDMLFICGASMIVLVGVSIGIAGITILCKKPRDILGELS